MRDFLIFLWYLRFLAFFHSGPSHEFHLGMERNASRSKILPIQMEEDEKKERRTGSRGKQSSLQFSFVRTREAIELFLTTISCFPKRRYNKLVIYSKFDLKKRIIGMIARETALDMIYDMTKMFPRDALGVLSFSAQIANIRKSVFYCSFWLLGERQARQGGQGASAPGPQGAGGFMKHNASMSRCFIKWSSINCLFSMSRS